MLERKDNIGDTTTSTGTGTISLAAVAQAGARIFAGNVTSGATVRYDIRSTDNTEWEIGEGIFTDGAPDTLTRVTIYASSNAGSLVNFSAGTKNVSMVLTAIDIADNVSIITNEIPTGLINSSNTVYTTTYDFIGSKTSVYLNRTRLKLNEDYTETSSNQVTLTVAPTTGDDLWIDYYRSDSVPIGNTSYQRINEVPAGLINSSNTVYTTAEPYIAGTLQVFLNGQLQTLTADYTETTSTTFTMGVAPVTGYTLIVTYQSNLSPAGNADTLDGQHAPTGTIVGTTDTQTLTNKTLSTGVALNALADPNITYYGMARQAIMNGNFDIWQRGTSVALADVTSTFRADRWKDYPSKDGGTLPTLTRSRQLLTSGDIPGAFYYARLETNGAGTSLGVNSRHLFHQKIENGTRNLCGLNKKVTVSFWAKSDIANKRICPTLSQIYGSGGSPSAIEEILGTPITLTSTWTKYTATFTTNTLVGKTFGTAFDDSLQLNLYTMWGTTAGNTYVQTGVSAETFVGAGNIDIAQVQLCSGDVALPFQPKSYEEELRACQRYYEVGYLKNYGYGSTGQPAGNNEKYKVTKRVSPTPVLTNQYSSNVGTTSTVDIKTANEFSAYRTVTSTGGCNFGDTWVADSEL